MGIDFGVYNPETNEFVIEDRFCDVGGFFNVCQMVGYANEMLRPFVHSDECKEHNPDMAKTGQITYDWLDQYTEQQNDEALEAFEKYVSFVQDFATTTLEEQKKEIENSPQLEPLAQDDMAHLAMLAQVNIEDFDPQIRAFFGRFILMGEDVTPDTSRMFAYWTHGLLGMMKGFSKQFTGSAEQEEAMLAAAMDSAIQYLEPLVQFADQCAEEEKTFQFDF